MLLSVFSSCFYVFADEGNKGENEKCKRIALTFDDGPCAKYDRRILDILDKYKIKATFFMVGENIEREPETAREIVSRGHEIGNHTYSHKKLGRLGRNELESEISRTESIIERVCGKKAVLFRPPEGYVSDTVGSVVTSDGYRLVLWSIDTLDWKGTSSDAICQKVMKGAKDGAIILCHDYIFGKSNTADAMEKFIPRLINNGYEFVTVSELLSDGTSSVNIALS